MDTDRKSAPTLRGKCGTYAGYSSHERYKEMSCEPCLFACRKYRREHRENNRARYRENQINWREKNPEKQRDQLEKYYLGNIDQVKLRTKIWKIQNPEKVLLSRIKSRVKNIERARQGKHKRRALLVGVPSEPYTAQDILNAHGSDCHICKEPIDLTAPRGPGKKGYQTGLHLDHVIPLSKGGSDLIENVKPSHAQCNLRKNARLVA